MNMDKYREYWSLSRSTYIENWPEDLIDYCMPTTVIPMSFAERDALYNTSLFVIEDIATKTSIEVVRLHYNNAMDKLTLGPDCLADRIQAAISRYSKAFVRLGSRSPKDSPTANYVNIKAFCVDNAKDALMILRDSERIYEDLFLAREKEYAPSIIIRQWIDIDPSLEFRVINIGEVLCVSQYNYHKGAWPRCIGGDPHTLHSRIRKLYEDIKHLLPEDIVFDIYLRGDYNIISCSPTTKPGNGDNSSMVLQGNIEWTCHLIEINPVMTLTDPCLYNWEKDDFLHDEFRFLDKEENVVRVYLG